jgi:hypothetical protein
MRTALAVTAAAVALATRAPAFPAGLTASDDAFLRAYQTTIELRDVRVPHCDALGAREGMLAYTNVAVNAHVPFPRVDRHGRYTGRTVFKIVHATLRLPRSITWPGMTETDRSAVRSALAALRHHEVGHVRVAAAEVARLNSLPPTVTPDALVYRHTEMRRQSAGLAAVAEAQRAYDAQTNHGRRQERAPAPFAGPATELRCPATGSNRRQQ